MSFWGVIQYLVLNVKSLHKEKALAKRKSRHGPQNMYFLFKLKLTFGI